MPNPATQQERVESALKQAKTKETLAGLTPAQQKMWESFSGEQQWRINQLPKADRVAEVERYYAKVQDVIKKSPLFQVEQEQPGAPTRESTVDQMIRERQRATQAATDLMVPWDAPELRAPTRESAIERRIRAQRELSEQYADMPVTEAVKKAYEGD